MVLGRNCEMLNRKLGQERIDFFCKGPVVPMRVQEKWEYLMFSANLSSTMKPPYFIFIRGWIIIPQVRIFMFWVKK
jgi:hypothetical protein